MTEEETTDDFPRYERNQVDAELVNFHRSAIADASFFPIYGNPNPPEKQIK